MTTPAGRIISLDILRFIGLAGVVLAHVAPPAWLMQLRNFDVVLLVMLSGATAYESSRQRELRFNVAAIRDRLIRLVLPLWVFLAFYFAVTGAQGALGGGFIFSAREVITSFTLGEGIGYVWIIRLFALLALITTPLLWWDRRCQSNWGYLLSVLAMLCCYQGVLTAYPSTQSELGDFWLHEGGYAVLAYGAIFALGVRMPRLSKGGIVGIGCVAAVIYGLAGVWLSKDASWLPTTLYKYPPHIYYLSYGVLVGVILYLLIDRFQFPIPMSAWIARLGGMTMWVYLWHIFMLYANGMLAARGWLPNVWWLSFAVVWGGAVLVTLLQYKLIGSYVQGCSPSQRKWLSIAFLK